MSKHTHEQPQDYPSTTSTWIYALVDPRNTAIRYIGKSINPKSRYSAHLSQYSLKKNTHKNHWIKSLLALGLKPELEFIAELHELDDWAAEEKLWIARFRSLALGYPLLTNATDGGDGVRGWIPSEEWRKKRSLAQTGRKMPPGTGDKISASNRGIPKSKQAREHFSEGQRNRWKNYSEEEKQEALLNLRTPWTEEKRKKRSIDSRKAPRKANATSQYLNVVKVNVGGSKPWRAACVLNGKFKFIGLFYAEEEAARARDRFVLKHIGESAPLNFSRADYD